VLFSKVNVEELMVINHVPDKTVGSCLDPELPRPVYRIGCRARPTQLKEKESVGTQQRWERHDEGQEEPLREVMQEDQQPTE
jgi:hypothetical protein